MERTDVTPDWNNYVYVVCPDEGVDAIYHVRNEKPGHDREGCDIAHSPVPR